MLFLPLEIRAWLRQGDKGVDVAEEKELYQTETKLIDYYLNIHDYKPAERSLRNYFKAVTAREAEKYVLPDPQISSLLEKYWVINSFSDIELVNSNGTSLSGFIAEFFVR